MMKSNEHSPRFHKTLKRQEQFKIQKEEEMDISIPQKVLKYEEFINDVLKEQLKKIEFDIDITLTEIAEFIQLGNIIQALLDNNLVQEGVKTQVDLGCNFYMQAFVKDPSKILVDIGLGYYVEFTLSEALIVIKRRTIVLNKKVDILRDQSAQTKAHIKLVLHGIQELQNLK
ncbi:protein UXT homolog [Macrosteles quadrilineatus]|uniref:protein UXT homolog n=1 Tax=Macrosteles quadrilineatus TaxID=74068 RepID=UPI0023E1954B|nr:protein UXT homolog [Macrosteles quadrilineatus]